MASTIRIKKSPAIGGQATPTTLAYGELAYSFTSNRLFVGDDSENVRTIGGEDYVSLIDHSAGTLTNSSAIIVDGSGKIDVINVDNITINGNTISSTDVNGNIIISPNGIGVISADTSKITNVTDPTSDQDASTKKYVDDQFAGAASALSIAGNAGTTAVVSSNEILRVLGGTGLSTTNADSDLTILVNLDNSGVTAGTYGSSSLVPVFTVNAQGQLDSAGTVAVAGVSSTSMDSSTGIFTINTADGQSFPRTLYDADILNNAGNKAGITWQVSGNDDEYRIAKDFVDSDLEVYTIREMLFSSSKLRIEVAQFTPGLTATGQANLNWDQAATSFAVSVDNPTDFPTRYINSVSAIAQTDAYVGATIGAYNAGSKSATPAGGTDWTQTFTFDSDAGAAVRDDSTTISGGTSIGTLTFADDQAVNFATTAPFTTSWKTPNVSISMTNLSGNTFLETYSTTNYSVSITNMQSAGNYTHTVTPTGGSVSSSTGSGTFTFTTPIHKDNISTARTLALSTLLSRPAGVATTTYSVTDTASDTSLSSTFTYPSFWIFTAATGTPPTRADIINVADFESTVTELSNQTITFAGTINNSGAVPKAFWFAVRSAITQPTTFETGASAALLSAVSSTSGTVSLEPDSPPGGYTAEGYNLYGITLQPGNTYVSIS